MTPATQATEIEQLDSAQQNAVVLFIRFLASRDTRSVDAIWRPRVRRTQTERIREGLLHGSRLR